MCEDHQRRLMQATQSEAFLQAAYVRAAPTWTRVGSETNVLFGVFLLDLQRLEETGVLPLAHQAMLENMVGDCWTAVASCSLWNLPIQ